MPRPFRSVADLKQLRLLLLAFFITLAVPTGLLRHQSGEAVGRGPAGGLGGDEGVGQLGQGAHSIGPAAARKRRAQPLA